MTMKEPNHRLFLAISLILLFIIAARTAIDSDFWWHLRAGQETIHQDSPMLYDTFSYSRLSQEWVNHSWLSQVILFGCYRLGSYSLVSLLVAAVAVLSMWMVVPLMKSGGMLDAFLLVFGGMVASVYWSPRPQIFSLLFLSCLGLVLYQDRAKGTKLRWAIPLLFILWGNLHGGYVLGLLYLGCYIIGMILEEFFQSSNRVDWKKIGQLVLITLLSFLLTAINPNGFKTWLIPFQTVGVEGLQNLISEWASPDFHQPVQMLFLLYFFSLIWCLALSPLKVKHGELLMLTVFGAMAFIARRNMTPFVLVSLPVFSRHLSPVLEEVKQSWIARRKPQTHKFAAPRDPSTAIQKIINGALLTLLLFTGLVKLVVVNQEEFVEEQIELMYPDRAVHWIEENHPTGEIFSEYNWGGYLIWRLHDYPVFIDGRTDLYGDEIIHQWVSVMNCAPHWEDILEQWNAQTLLVSPSRAVIGCALHAGWKEVYKDENSVLLTKNAGVQSP